MKCNFYFTISLSIIMPKYFLQMFFHQYFYYFHKHFDNQQDMINTFAKFLQLQVFSPTAIVS
jgi:hypothetical protein